MSKQACKCKKTECEECPEWIFTFADLVMLMMGFFVILWVLKPPAGKQGANDSEAAAEQKKWLQTVGEIRKGLGYVPDPRSADPVDKVMLEIQNEKARGLKEGDETDHKRESPPGTDHEPTSVRPGNHSVVGAHLSFDAASATLLPETSRTLDEIADNIRGHYMIVLIKGHASLDDLPDDASAAQKMALSLRRAQVTAEYLESKGVSPDVLRVQGCSTFEPVKQRVYTHEAQADNRRVEVEWTSELLDQRKDPGNVPLKPVDAQPEPSTDAKENAADLPEKSGENKNKPEATAK